MIVWLVDFDGKMENLALMRLSTYHRTQGDKVTLKYGDARPELFETPDRVYISSLFRWNYRRATSLKDAWNGRGIIGGTGIDPMAELPPEVVSCGPDYELYGNTRAVGFLSRGCPRNCPWCVVPHKEGGIHRVATVQEIVGDRKEAIFLDNNHLALPDHLDDLRWLADMQVAIDFNQGMDARLITADNAKLLGKCKWCTPGSKKIRLACDSDGQIWAMDRAFKLLSEAGIHPYEVFVYCLIGFHGLESDIKRLRFLRSWNACVFPMGYRDLETGAEPAKGWDRQLYKKYRRLICRLPHAKSVWDDFEKEISLPLAGG